VDGLGGEVVGEEEECIYPLGFSISSEEFFVEVDVSLGVYTGLSLAGFELDGAVDVIIIKGFIEVSSIAEDTLGGVPAIIVPLLGVVGVREQVHRRAADAVLPGALGACVCTYVVASFGEQIVVFGAACVDGFLWADTKEA
jgi:hypothetical protein